MPVPLISRSYRAEADQFAVRTDCDAGRVRLSRGQRPAIHADHAVDDVDHGIVAACARRRVRVLPSRFNVALALLTLSDRAETLLMFIVTV
jgi:hypothetical protein